ncbi:MAG: ChbG/HpnK family deacetylase, partial [Xanthobacteraceae bacterium]|nr:ChbG/HpnK family deacetylase [Xanthobacteraceae bacterium]
PACEEAVALALQCPKLSLGLHLELDGVAPKNVPAEIERQQMRFVELVGSAPTHVDTHHDLHRDPEVLSPLLAWGRRIKVPVRGHSEVRYVPKFYGRSGGETDLDQIGVDALLRLLDEEVREGMTELNCHPGHPEAGFPSSYAAEREVEVRTLCDPKLRKEILERGFRLLGFRDLYRSRT